MPVPSTLTKNLRRLMFHQFQAAMPQSEPVPQGFAGQSPACRPGRTPLGGGDVGEVGQLSQRLPAANCEVARKERSRSMAGIRVHARTRCEIGAGSMMYIVTLRPSGQRRVEDFRERGECSPGAGASW